MIVLVRLSAGMIGWAVAFCLIYALHGMSCAAGWEMARLGGISVHRAILFAGWGLSLAAMLSIALWLRRYRSTSLDRAAAALGWVGFVATIVTFAPITVVPACT